MNLGKISVPTMAAALLSATPSLAKNEYEPALTPAGNAPGAAVIEERYADGTLKLRRTEVDGKAEGVWQEWHEDGSPRYIGQWKDGLGEGVWTYFYPNGQIRHQAWVARDVWHGPTEGWHENGAKAFSGVMVDGNKLQPFDYWKDNGDWAGPLPQAAEGERVRLFEEDWPDDLNQWDFTFTPDLETLFFGTGTDEGDNRRIMIRRWKGGIWSAPEPAPFAELDAAEGTPIISPDGEYLYFSSDRQRATEPENVRRDLYRVSRVSGWTEVERVTNTPLYGEISFSVACDGRGALWTAWRPDGSSEMGLYEVLLEDGRLEIVRSLNDLHTDDVSNENYAVITPDGNALIFANYDIGGDDTDEDLYLVRRTAAGWSDPVSLGPKVNTGDGDSHPVFTADGRHLLFSSADEDGKGWFATRMETLGLGDLVTPALSRDRCNVPHR